MGWFKLDDKSAFHAKVTAAGNAAYGAWCRMGAWSSGSTPRGFVPLHQAKIIARATEITRLLEVRLLEAAERGYTIHDYFDWNPTDEQIEAKRVAAAERVARWRERNGGSTPPPSNAVGNAVTDALVTDDSAQLPRTHPVPKIPDPPVPSGPPPGGGVRAAPRIAKPDLNPGELTPREALAARAIATDPSFPPIVRRPNQLARDLCAIGPGVDVPAEVARAGAWMRADQKRQKHNGNRFLVGWVKSQQDQGPRQSGTMLRSRHQGQPAPVGGTLWQAGEVIR